MKVWSPRRSVLGNHVGDAPVGRLLVDGDSALAPWKNVTFAGRRSRRTRVAGESVTVSQLGPYIFAASASRDAVGRASEDRKRRVHDRAIRPCSGSPGCRCGTGRSRRRSSSGPSSRCWPRSPDRRAVGVPFTGFSGIGGLLTGEIGGSGIGEWGGGSVAEAPPVVLGAERGVAAAGAAVELDWAWHAIGIVHDVR